MLAKAIREDPNLEKMRLMAEFSEPYGTMSALNTISEGNAGMLDYLSAVPFVGGAARVAKKAKRFTDKAMKTASKEANAFKGKTTMVDMNIDDYLSLAEYGVDAGKTKALKNIEEFDDVPYLKMKFDGDTAKVTGHEGRHRARRLKEMGETSMPVRMKGDEIRFDQQNPSDWDFQKQWPTKIESETGGIIGDFPIQQGESGILSKDIIMNLKSTEKEAILTDLLKEFDL